MKARFKREALEFKLLLKNIPAWVLTLFSMSVFAMNLLANKSIDLGVDWLALDCGFIVSWISFLTMDVIVKHFGPKAATSISVLAMLISLLFCMVFFVGGIIPGTWSESYVDGSEDVINTALNKTFGGTWYVILGSALAFFLSSLVNNLTNSLIGKAFRKNPDGAAAYAARSFGSTAIGQFVDNMTFALTVSHVFFGWSLLQCVTCSITGMLFELLAEVIFTPFGYAVCKCWKKDGVGESYLRFKEDRI